MAFSYVNGSTTGHYFYTGGVYPSFSVNYNPYFFPCHSNSNGLLPTPSQQTRLPTMKTNNIQNCKSIISNNSKTKSSLILSHQEKKHSNSTTTVRLSEMKTKPISELNPLANEFSLEKLNSEKLNTDNEKNSSYKFIFDSLIEKSLQSIEAINKASKKVSVNHVAIQHDQSIDHVSCSTQTSNNDLLTEHSTYSVELMNKLFEKFKYALFSPNTKDLHNQLEQMSYILDELHYLILVINQILVSNKASIDRDHIFSDTMKSHSMESSMNSFGVENRRIDQLISSMASVSSRKLDPITTARSKMCLLCQKHVANNDDTMHELCRLLSSPPDSHIC